MMLICMNILLLLKQSLMYLYLYRTSIIYINIINYSLSLYVGIGSPLGSIPLAATLSWIIKDGLGQLGRR